MSITPSSINNVFIFRYLAIIFFKKHQGVRVWFRCDWTKLINNEKPLVQQGVFSEMKIGKNDLFTN